MSSNLPNNTTDSATEVKNFYGTYFTEGVSYPASEVDAVTAFFTSRGFDESAAGAVSGVLLLQAKLDNVKVFKLLDTLKGLDKLKLSAIVTEVLNYNRPRSSTLGYRVDAPTALIEARNILA
jgi:hypothetical protein|tara:strand:- start:3137 stop:3502 length:366 start_codon:yes stop_codon:yes gene_type:complete